MINKAALSILLLAILLVYNDYTIVMTYIIAYLYIYIVLSMFTADCKYYDLLVYIGSVWA